MLKPKFELTSETKTIGKIKLYRIKALVDGKYYKKGDIGGWVQSLKLKNKKDRISDNAWVCGDARVFGDARVYDDARVYNNAQVYGDARVCGNAQVYGKVKLKSILCSRFMFEFDWQVKLWERLETEFQQKSKILKDI